MNLSIEEQTDPRRMTIGIGGPVGPGDQQSLVLLGEELTMGGRLAPVRLELDEVDSLAPGVIAVLTDLIRDLLASGAQVTIHAAPQMLAHTIYKVGLSKNPRLTLDGIQPEAPYAG